ncbi:acyl carrier protein [Fibrobacterota bacterium]
MNTEDVLKEMNEIFIDVLELDDIDLKAETTTDDVEEWDSLTHIPLIAAIESHFKIKFKSSEIQNWKNVGEMCDAVIGKAG